MESLYCLGHTRTTSRFRADANTGHPMKPAWTLTHSQKIEQVSALI